MRTNVFGCILIWLQNAFSVFGLIGWVWVCVCVSAWYIWARGLGISNSSMAFFLYYLKCIFRLLLAVLFASTHSRVMMQERIISCSMVYWYLLLLNHVASIKLISILQSAHIYTHAYPDRSIPDFPKRILSLPVSPCAAHNSVTHSQNANKK